MGRFGPIIPTQSAMRSRKKPATGGRATGYSYSLVLQDNDQPDLIVPMSWSGRSVLLCTNCGVASSLLIPTGDFISPDLPIEDTGPLRPSGGEFDPSRLKAKILPTLPKMAKAAQSKDLKAAFVKHERETREQVKRLVARR